MKLPRGFRKNYFSLSAITATVNAISISKESVRTQNYHIDYIFGNDDDIMEELEEDTLPCILEIITFKPCQCNCYFLKRAKNFLKLFRYIKFQLYHLIPFYSDISPPYLNHINFKI